MKALIRRKNGIEEVDINRRKAIREKCLNCSSWSPKEVKECDVHACDLYDFRLGAGKQDAKKRTKSINTYCTWCMGGDKYEIKRCTVETCPLYSFRIGARSTNKAI